MELRSKRGKEEVHEDWAFAFEALQRLPSRTVQLGVRRYHAAPNRYEARLTLHAPADEIAARVPKYWGTVTPIDDRTCEYRSGDDNLEWLAIRVAMLNVDFEVHEPPELAEQLGALADRLARAATGSRRSSRPGAA